MPRKPREPRRRKLAPVEPPKPLLQVMPLGRVRLDPTSVRELTAWVCAYASKYRTTATKTLRGLKGAERKYVLASRRAAEAAIEVLFLFAAGLTDTLDVRLIDSALREWDVAAGAIPAEMPDVLPFVTPSIPGTE